MLCAYIYAGIDAFYAYVEVIALDATEMTDTTSLLSDVRTVGNAINKLLFHLPEPCGLNDLVTACDDFCREESFSSKIAGKHIHVTCHEPCCYCMYKYFLTVLKLLQDVCPKFLQ